MSFRFLSKDKLDKLKIGLLFTAVILVGCQSQNSSPTHLNISAKNRFTKVVKLENSLLDASKDEMFAPEHFAQANEFLIRAKVAANNNDMQANELAAEGFDKLSQAQEIASKNKDSLYDLHLARNKAISVGADKLYKPEFDNTEGQIAKAIKYLNNGNIDDAKKIEAKLIPELESIVFKTEKQNVTSVAKLSMKDAITFKADTLAPKTYKLAQAEYKLAVQTLQNNPDDIATSDMHAKKAAYYSNKAKFLAIAIQGYKTRKNSLEDVLLEHQEHLNVLHTQLSGDEMDFNISPHKVVENLESQIVALQKATSANASIARNLHNDVKSLQNKIYDDKGRFAELASLFSSDEAEVVKDDKNIIIRLHGLNYKVSSNELDDSNYPLIEKVITGIKKYGNPEIKVIGHTDSTGDVSINLKVSKARAETLAKFLFNIGKFDQGKIKTLGLGKSRPYANNETAEGRKMNRRVEVVVMNVN